MDTLYYLKIAAVDFSGLAKDALHIYVAIAVFISSCIIFRWRASQWKPLLLVLLIALIGESFDIRFNLRNESHIFLSASLHDLWNTLLVPLIIFTAARYSRIFEKPKPAMSVDEDLGDEPEV